MPAYHSAFNDVPHQSLGNIAVLPLNTTMRGPAPKGDGSQDIVDEALYFFKANVFFKNYEIKGEADRVLVYLTLFISDCLNVLQKCPNKNEGKKALNTLALGNFAIPGEGAFPLNSMYNCPGSKEQMDQLRQYFTQLRQEMSMRLLEKVFVDDKPSKWWTSFTKRKFMNKSL
eukprot:Nk52_evm95s1810 gene=Nk52_evmTU95s1810